jgi:cytochrome P450
MDQLTPFTAVTAADPYPYYARLVRERPFHRDDGLQTWVAASAAAVEAALTSSSLRVRPASERVPAALAGTAVGDVFARLVRMNDGLDHAALKGLVGRTLDSPRPQDLRAVAESCAYAASQIVTADRPETVTEYLFELPAVVLASLLGLAPDPQTVTCARDVARAIGPNRGGDDTARGAAAVTTLHDALRSSISAAPRSLSGFMLNDARRYAFDEAAAMANLIGFFFQSYDATAGLMANALVALGAAPAALRTAAVRDPFTLEKILAEVARYDAPIQNTSRFAAEKTVVLGSTVREGEGVTVILAAANRDPSLNLDPDRFDPDRKERRSYSFGAGEHACPGARLAMTIAQAGISRLLACGIDGTALSVVGYQPSLNARLPIFARRDG